MNAIITEYHPARAGATAHMSATTEDDQMIIPYDYESPASVNHHEAARALRAKLGRDVPMVGGSHGNQMAWVFVSTEHLI